MTQEQVLEILKLGHNVYLTGPPGSGKTFLLNKYISYLKKKNAKVAVTASTGIAATHLDGITIHSWSGLGIKEKLTEEDINKLLKRHYLKKRFQTTNVLIIDEVSMLHPFQFDFINRICQAFKGNLMPFGGIQVVCSGDFFQLPPVEKGNIETEFVTASHSWQNMALRICYLQEQHRHSDPELSTILNDIRNNSFNERSRQLLSRGYKDTLLTIHTPTKLYTHNIDVDAINNLKLDEISGKKFIYQMHSDGNLKLVEILKKSCLAPEKLSLKKGALVMFVKNNFDKGYINGTMGKVISFDDDSRPIVKTFVNKNIVVTPTNWIIREDDVIKASISQIPLRLAWAITVHKSQGMTLDAAEIDLSKSFVKGMGYVALSRMRSLAGIKLMGINDLALKVDERILDLDKELMEASQRLAADLERLSPREKSKKQREFLKIVAPKDKQGKRGKKSRRFGSVGEEIKMLVAQKLSIKDMAEHRGVKEDTIMSHLEKLIAHREALDLEYLRLPSDRFEKIRDAFEECGDWRLTPVREVLGEDFSYNELKLARLFLNER